MPRHGNFGSGAGVALQLFVEREAIACGNPLVELASGVIRLLCLTTKGSCHCHSIIPMECSVSYEIVYQIEVFATRPGADPPPRRLLPLRAFLSFFSLLNLNASLTASSRPGTPTRSSPLNSQQFFPITSHCQSLAFATVSTLGRLFKSGQKVNCR